MNKNSKPGDVWDDKEGWVSPHRKAVLDSTDLLAPLGVAVVGDDLVIRIGCSRLDGNEDHPEIPELPITDPHQWARGIAAEMNRDRGDGATPLSLFIDEMIHEAVSMGTSGIDHKRLAEIRRANASG